MSCNTCANQAISAMSQVGVPGSMCRAAWGSAPQRCATRGKWLGRGGICVDPRCAGRVKDAHVAQGMLIIPRGASCDDTVEDVAGVVRRGMIDAGIAGEERPWMVMFSASGPSSSRWKAGRITIGTERGFPAPAEPGVRLVDQDTATSFAPGGVNGWSLAASDVA